MENWNAIVLYVPGAEWQQRAQSSIVCSPAEELNSLKFVKASL